MQIVFRKFPILRVMAAFLLVLAAMLLANRLFLARHDPDVIQDGHAGRGTLPQGLGAERNLWEVRKWKEAGTLRGHSGSVTGLAYSPDGQRLVSTDEGGVVKLWDALTGVEIFTLSAHRRPVRSVAFSPDGRTLATGSEDTTVKLWLGAARNEVCSRPSPE